MVTALVFLLAQRAPTDILDGFAQSRDVRSLSQMAPDLETGHFRYIEKTGAFSGGRFGWRVLPLQDPAQPNVLYAVFSTPLTIQDYGEQVYRLDDGLLAEHFPEETNFGVLPKHYELNLRVEPERSRVVVDCKIDLVTSAERKPSFFIRLSPHYKVTALKSASGEAIPFTQAGGVVCAPTPVGSTTWTISYEGLPDLTRFAGTVTKKEAMLTDDYFWPSIGRYPATTTMHADIPANWEVISNGTRTAQTTEGDRKKAIFVNNLAISYLSFSAGEFSITREAPVAGQIIHAVMANNMSEEERKLQMEMQKPVIDFYGKTFGPWPYKGWVTLSSESYGGAALEGYSYATYAPNWLPDSDAHEPSHTYFGGVISNTYLRSFWNESFASFCEGFYEREVEIGNREERRLAFVSNPFPSPTWNNGIIVESGVMTGDLSADLGYGKGAVVLQMLEHEMGTEAFVASVRRWLSEHPKGTPGEWEDYFAVLGPEYETFIDQWFRRPGWARFRIGNVRYEDDHLKGDVTFTGTPYRIVSDLLVETPGGSRNLVRVTLNPTGKEATSEWSVALPEEPVRGAFDPYERIMMMRSATGPAQLSRELGRLQAVVHPDAQAWANSADLGRTTVTPDFPANPANRVLVGNPDQWPQLLPLLEQAGMTVNGNELTYDGTTIDLTKGGAAAIVAAPDGQPIVLLLGQTRRPMKTGKARIALCNEYGFFLRGLTEPRMEGELAFRL